MVVMEIAEIMDFVVHWAGFVGAWLLVAGPLVQAAMELRDEQLDREAIQTATGQAPPAERISNWWWLLPPVAYVKTMRRGQERRAASLDALSVPQREQMIGFLNKATGWLYVAGGASLIFVKEAWELTELYHLPFFVYLIVVVLLALLAVANTVVRLRMSDQMIHRGDADWAAAQAAGRSDRRAVGRPGRAARSQRTPTGDAGDVS